MVVKTETFTDENGIKFVKEYHGTDENNIIGVVQFPFVEPVPEPKPTMTDEQQTLLDMAMNIEYLVCMQELSI